MNLAHQITPFPPFVADTSSTCSLPFLDAHVVPPEPFKLFTPSTLHNLWPGIFCIPTTSLTQSTAGNRAKSILEPDFWPKALKNQLLDDLSLFLLSLEDCLRRFAAQSPASMSQQSLCQDAIIQSETFAQGQCALLRDRLKRLPEKVIWHSAYQELLWRIDQCDAAVTLFSQRLRALILLPEIDALTSQIRTDCRYLRHLDQSLSLPSNIDLFLHCDRLAILEARVFDLGFSDAPELVLCREHLARARQSLDQLESRLDQMHTSLSIYDFAPMLDDYFSVLWSFRKLPNISLPRTRSDFMSAVSVATSLVRPNTSYRSLWQRFVDKDIDDFPRLQNVFESLAAMPLIDAREHEKRIYELSVYLKTVLSTFSRYRAQALSVLTPTDRERYYVAIKRFSLALSAMSLFQKIYDASHLRRPI